MTNVFSWQNSVSRCPPSFCTPRPNLPVIMGYPLTSYFAFQTPIVKKNLFIYFLVLVLEGVVCLHRSGQLQLL